MKLRPFLTVLLAGLIWYGAFYVFFISSGAQNILSNPAHQSGKFLRVFMEIEPLPRMVNDPWLVLKGFFLIGMLIGGVFVWLSQQWKGNWIQKGLKFGLIHWMLMVPWFEFYLPYNVMNEPFALVLLEAALWLGTTLTLGIALGAVRYGRLQPINGIQK